MKTKISLTILLSLSAMTVFAQLPIISGPSGPPATPIDGGLITLLIAGGLFGIKKIKDLKN